MPASDNNILQQVITYQPAALAYLQNTMPMVKTANTKFKEFDKIFANLGDTVSFDKPYRFRSGQGLVVTWEGVEQRVQTLKVDQAQHVSYPFTAQQFIFNTERFMEDIGMGAVKELGSDVEKQVEENICLNFPYLFYGDGNTAINSYGQLAEILALQEDFGMPAGKAKMYLPVLAVPSIVNSGLSQFVLKRNEETANSWELGAYGNCEFYKSNLLPTHIAGTCGRAQDTLTVVSTNDPTGANITQITCSGVTTNAGAIAKNDLLYFLDGVGSFPNMHYLTFVGHSPSQNPVQIRATDAADGTAGNVTFNIYPALSMTPGKNQNITYNVQAGMQLKAIRSHRRAILICGNSHFIAMPQLPDETPYPTSAKMDPESKVSMRLYYGALFGQNQRGYVFDCIWGSTAVPEYLRAICFPL